ncbi:MAG: glycosyltransferase [Phycisphaera sp.]|nr:glycosyltransferase [Phycisphaera sp.]
MRIVQLTPGTGNFYCGNCMRDNALVHTLREMGHDVLMIPLYLPHVVDEPSEVHGTPLFFGGINVYLQQKSSLFRHTPGWVDHMLDNHGLLRWAADKASMTSARELGELTMSMLQGEHGRQNKELTKLIEWLEEQGPIDVVCLSNALLLGLARRIKQELKCRVVCTLSGEDAFLDTLIEPYRTQCWDELATRAADVDAFIAVSRYYGDVMGERMKVPDERMHVVLNGINLAGYEPAETPPSPHAVGFLARMCHGKGLATLVEAFIVLKSRDRVPGLRLRVAGSQTKEDESYVQQLCEQLDRAGCAGDVEWLPNVSHEDKQRFLREVSVLSVPATYGESFGLYIIEALASGVPVVQPRCAAFVELVEGLHGGILCEPDNAEALADALEIALLRYDEMKSMATAARERVHSHFTVERMAREVLDVFEGKNNPTTPAAEEQVTGR